MDLFAAATLSGYRQRRRDSLVRLTLADLAYRASPAALCTVTRFVGFSFSPARFEIIVHETW